MVQDQFHWAGAQWAPIKHHRHKRQDARHVIAMVGVANDGYGNGAGADSPMPARCVHNHHFQALCEHAYQTGQKEQAKAHIHDGLASGV